MALSRRRIGCRAIVMGSSIAHLDIEHVNFDHHGAAICRRWPGFRDAGTGCYAVTKILGSYGIRPLRLLSGRGHHFVWKISKSSEAFGQLAWLGRTAPSTRARYAQPQPPRGEVVGDELGSAFAGLGQVMEFVAHRILDRATMDFASQPTNSAERMMSNATLEAAIASARVWP